MSTNRRRTKMSMVGLMFTTLLFFASVGFPPRVMSSTQEERKEQKVKKEVFRTFSGKIKEIVKITSYQGKAVVIGHDPRWVISVEIESSRSDQTKSRAVESLVAYAIHSPTKLLGASSDEALGQLFQFDEYRLVGRDGKDLGRELTATRKKR